MSKTKITVNSNGSLKVEGDFEITDKTDDPYYYKVTTKYDIYVYPLFDKY